MPGVETCPHSVTPSADLRPDVRRHVVDVAGAGNRAAEEFGARGGAPRLARRFGDVDVQMARAGMTDVGLQRPLQHADDPLDIRARDVPRACARLEEKQRLGVERCHVEVVRKRIDDRLHGVGVGAVLIRASGRIEALDVTNRHRPNQRTLDRRAVRGGERCRLLNRGVGERGLLGGHGPIQIRPPCPGFTPVADRALRIPDLASRKDRTASGLAKAYSQLEPLVEVRLRFAVLGRNRPRERSYRGLVETDFPVERGWRCAVLLMLIGRRGLRLAARGGEPCDYCGAHRAGKPIVRLPEHTATIPQPPLVHHTEPQRSASNRTRVQASRAVGANPGVESGRSAANHTGLEVVQTPVRRSANERASEPTRAASAAERLRRPRRSANVAERAAKSERSAVSLAGAGVPAYQEKCKGVRGAKPFGVIKEFG